jgi:Zn-dependent M28 family amino/carboxypeptidase
MFDDSNVTTTKTTGVDDNGSGVTALLQAAKNIGEQ